MTGRARTGATSFGEDAQGAGAEVAAGGGAAGSGEEAEGGCIVARRRRHTRSERDWSSDVCCSDLAQGRAGAGGGVRAEAAGGGGAGARAESEGTAGGGARS